MFKIIDIRDSGKTRKLLTECSKDEKALFVCAHPGRVVDKCKAYGLPNVDSIGYKEFIEMQDDEFTKNRNIYIDELELYVKELVNLKGYSLTTTD